MKERGYAAFFHRHPEGNWRCKAWLVSMMYRGSIVSYGEFYELRGYIARGLGQWVQLSIESLVGMPGLSMVICICWSLSGQEGFKGSHTTYLFMCRYFCILPTWYTDVLYVVYVCCRFPR